MLFIIRNQHSSLICLFLPPHYAIFWPKAIFAPSLQAFDVDGSSSLLVLQSEHSGQLDLPCDIYGIHSRLETGIPVRKQRFFSTMRVPQLYELSST